MANTNEVNKFDLDQLDETQVSEIVEINPDLNALEAPPPVEDGTWRTKLLPLDTSAIEVKTTNPKKGGNPQPFIGFRFSGAVISEGTPNNNKRIFGRVNTLVFDGKSEIAQYIKIAKGDTPEARALVRTLDNYVKLSKSFRDTLAAEPIIKVKTKWVAQAKDTDDKGNVTYRTVLSGMKNFPPKPGGGFEHIILDKKSGQEVAAQAVIVDIFPDKQATA